MGNTTEFRARCRRTGIVVAVAGLMAMGLQTGVAQATYETCVDQRTGQVRLANKVGTEGADAITASSGDVIAANGGDDVVYVGEWDDNVVVCLGDGNDRTTFDFTPAAGSLSVMGGPGDDRIAGGNANDTLNGGTGYDSVFAAGGVDVCRNAEFMQNCEYLG